MSSLALRLPFAAFLAVGLAKGAPALSLRFDFADAVRTSTLVAWVEIERGEMLRSSTGSICGARYTARVVSSIKGATAGQKIEFGHHLGRAIGGQYVVFLNEPRSGDGGCPDRLVRYAEVAEGLGTIPVEPGEHVSFRPAVSLSGPPYVIPSALASQGYRRGVLGEDVLFGSVQVEASSFFEFLRTLAGVR